MTGYFQKKNDAGLKRLADDLRNLVYAIYCANRRNEEEGVPQQVERALTCVKLHVLDFPSFFSTSRRFQKRSLLVLCSRLSYGLKRMQNGYNTIGRS